MAIRAKNDRLDPIGDTQWMCWANKGIPLTPLVRYL